MRLWIWASGWQEIPFIINALCYGLINMSFFPTIFLPFCLSAYFSIHQVHLVSSQLDGLEVNEGELKNQ